MRTSIYLPTNLGIRRLRVLWNPSSSSSILCFLVLTEGFIFLSVALCSSILSSKSQFFFKRLKIMATKQIESNDVFLWMTKNNDDVIKRSEFLIELIIKCERAFGQFNLKKDLLMLYYSVFSWNHLAFIKSLAKTNIYAKPCNIRIGCGIIICLFFVHWFVFNASS